MLHHGSSNNITRHWRMWWTLRWCLKMWRIRPFLNRLLWKIRMFLVVGMSRLENRVTEEERIEERMEVKVQTQMIRGPGRQDSWMTEKERKKGRKEDKVDTWTIGSPGIYGRLWKSFEKIQEQWNAEILWSPAVLVKEELPKIIMTAHGRNKVGYSERED